MPVIDKTLPDSEKSIVHIEREGIRTTGVYCLAEVSIEFSRKGENGKRFTAAQRLSKARELAAKDGWRSPRGFDECPKIHGFMPTSKVNERPEL